jgi:group I intron endonuclease
MKKIENKNCGIYGIYNHKNQVLYIGSSIDLDRRYKEHYSSLLMGNHKNEDLLKFSKLYGIDNLIFKIINLCEYDELSFNEVFYIKLLSPICNKTYSELNKYKPTFDKFKDNDYDKIRNYISEIDKNLILKSSEISKVLNVSTKKIGSILKLYGYKLNNGKDGRIWIIQK